MPRFDLEYLLLFGPPENKLELIDGKTPCSFPFLDRDDADEHFQRWSRTLSRWQRVADSPARVVEGNPVKEFGRFTLTQHRRPIRLEVNGLLYRNLLETTADRKAWDWGE